MKNLANISICDYDGCSFCAAYEIGGKKYCIIHYDVVMKKQAKKSVDKMYRHMKK